MPTANQPHDKDRHGMLVIALAMEALYQASRQPRYDFLTSRFTTHTLSPCQNLDNPDAHLYVVAESGKAQLGHFASLRARACSYMLRPGSATCLGMRVEQYAAASSTSSGGFRHLPLIEHCQRAGRWCHFTIQRFDHRSKWVCEFGQYFFERVALGKHDLPVVSLQCRCRYQPGGHSHCPGSSSCR
jgi:hypothetical protein